MTAAGHKALEEELNRRQTEERSSIIAAIAEARSHGDLSEECGISCCQRTTEPE